ncbi:MAG: DUF4136 domain-containing protein [Gammaproteobacteria bacterium]|nr:hypothetical protein [Gammaproteobacteria bacterium]
MMRKVTLMLSMALVLCACATTSEVRVDRAADVDLTRCRTFGWLSQTKDPESLTDRRVRAAALAELERKGYSLEQDAPDCRITYIFSAYERPTPKPRVGVGASGGSRGMGGGIGVSLPIGRQDRYRATLTLDVVDTAKNAQIWSGALDVSLSEPELSEEAARAIVAEILAHFPDRT